MEAELDAEAESVELVESELDGLVEVVMLIELVTDSELESD